MRRQLFDVKPCMWKGHRAGVRGGGGETTHPSSLQSLVRSPRADWVKNTRNADKSTLRLIAIRIAPFARWFGAMFKCRSGQR